MAPTTLIAGHETLAEPTRKDRFIKIGADWKGFVGPIVIAFAATSVALAYHFVYGHTKSTLIYDARSYLWTSAQISQFLVDLSHLKWSWDLVTTPEFRVHLFNDGPVYTTFIGSLFALIQHIPTQKDWTVVEVIQSVLHGLSTVLVFDLTRRLVRTGDASMSAESASRVSNIAGYAAALIWGFYPAAIVATGFLYTEPLVVFVVLLFAWASAASSESLKANLLSGGSGALLVLIKPVLAPAALVGCLMRIVLSPKRVRTLLLVAVGMALTIMPWSLYTHFVCGKMQVTTPRFAAYNVVMGSDLESDGRLCIPITPMTNLFSSDESPIYFVASQWRWHPIESLQMVARKVTRLLTYSWNDFRHVYFGLTAPQQRWWHLAVLYLGLAGAVYVVATRNVERSSRPAIVALSLMWMPLVYLLFEANSRYGFTIMPMYAAFAGLFLAYLITGQGSKWKVALSAVLAVLGLVVFLKIGDWACTGAPSETMIEIGNGKTLVTSIDLSKVSEPKVNYEPVVLVDGEQPLETAKIEFNGHPLQNLRGLRYFDSSTYDGYYVTKEIANAMNVPQANFRQWRLARVPKQFINWSSGNEIKITAEESGTIYGDTAVQVDCLPSLRHFCTNKLCNSPEGYETRSPLLRPSKKAYQSSRIEGDRGNLTGSQRVRLALVLDSPRKRKLILPLSNFGLRDPSALAEKRQVLGQELRPEKFPFIMRGNNGDGSIRTNRFVAEHAAPVAEIQLPEPLSSENRLAVSLTGEVKAMSPGAASAVITNGRFAVLSTNPTALAVDTKWKPFQLEDTMPLVLLRKKDGGYALTVGLYPGPWLDETGYGSNRQSTDATFRNLKLKVWYSKELDLCGRQVFVY